MQKCSSCGSSHVLVETLQNGDFRVECKKCGFKEFRDKKGRKLLVG